MAVSFEVSWYTTSIKTTFLDRPTPHLSTSKGSILTTRCRCLPTFPSLALRKCRQETFPMGENRIWLHQDQTQGPEASASATSSLFRPWIFQPAPCHVGGTRFEPTEILAVDWSNCWVLAQLTASSGGNPTMPDISVGEDSVDPSKPIGLTGWNLKQPENMLVFFQTSAPYICIRSLVLWSDNICSACFFSTDDLFIDCMLGFLPPNVKHFNSIWGLMMPLL